MPYFPQNGGRLRRGLGQEAAARHRGRSGPSFALPVFGLNWRCDHEEQVTRPLSSRAPRAASGEPLRRRPRASRVRGRTQAEGRRRAARRKRRPRNSGEIDETDRAMITSAVSAVFAPLGERGLDGLVNNAGIGTSAPLGPPGTVVGAVLGSAADALDLLDFGVQCHRLPGEKREARREDWRQWG